LLESDDRLAFSALVPTLGAAALTPEELETLAQIAEKRLMWPRGRRKALINTLGHIGRAAKQLDISRSSLTRRIKAEPELRQFIDEITDEVIDDVEKVLIKCALAGEPWAVRF
jgi:hypothetical protein